MTKGSFKNLPKGSPWWKKLIVASANNIVENTTPTALKKHAKNKLTKKNIHVGRTLKKAAWFGIAARFAHPLAAWTLAKLPLAGLLLSDYAGVPQGDHLAYITAVYAAGLLAGLEVIKYQLGFKIKFIL